MLFCTTKNVQSYLGYSLCRTYIIAKENAINGVICMLQCDGRGCIKKFLRVQLNRSKRVCLFNCSHLEIWLPLMKLRSTGDYGWVMFMLERERERWFIPWWVIDWCGRSLARVELQTQPTVCSYKCAYLPTDLYECCVSCFSCRKWRREIHSGKSSM